MPMSKEITEQYTKARLEFDKYLQLVKDVQDKCEHLSVGEKPYKNNTYFNDTPPARICIDCGLIEEGWSFKVLTPKHVYKFTEQEFQDYVVTKIMC